MIRVNIHDVKTHLSEYLAQLEQGETIIICRRNRPVAEIRPLPERSAGRRPLGLAKEIFQVPESFFEHLPDEILRSFSGDEG